VTTREAVPPVAAGGARQEPRLSLAEVVRLFEGTADGVYVVDSEQRIVAWTAAAERLLGRRADDVRGRHCYEVIAGIDGEGRPFCRPDCPVMVCARRGRAVPNYDVLATSAARRVWINVSIVVVRAAGFARPLAVHLFRDVSRRRRAEIMAQQTIAGVSRLLLGECDAPPVAGPIATQEPRLTAREVEVLRLLAAGLTVREIAADLVISSTTVRNHIESLMGKLGVHSRLQAILYAARHDLL
jgi:PAS domain S-box-containing protein